MQIEFSNGSLFVDGKEVEFLVFKNNEMIDFPIEMAGRPQISSFMLLGHVGGCLKSQPRTNENINRVVAVIDAFISETLEADRVRPATKKSVNAKTPPIESSAKPAKSKMSDMLYSLYNGTSLSLAIKQLESAKRRRKSDKEAFLFAVWSIERMYRKIGVNEDEDVVLPSYEDTVNDILENGPDPKTRLFTADEMAIAIEFFTQRIIPVEHVISWGRGIDPYGNEGLSESDYYTGLTREG